MRVVLPGNGTSTVSRIRSVSMLTQATPETGERVTNAALSPGAYSFLSRPLTSSEVGVSTGTSSSPGPVTNDSALTGRSPGPDTTAT